MKYALLSLFAIIFTLASCSKDRVCSCRYEDGNDQLQTSSKTINNSSRGDADDICDVEEINLRNAGNDDVNCELID